MLRGNAKFGIQSETSAAILTLTAGVKGGSCWQLLLWPPVRKVVAGAGYFAICLADYLIRLIEDASAAHLEPRWKFSDLLAIYEIPGATAFLWGNTYLQFWNRDKEKCLMGHIGRLSLCHAVGRQARRNRRYRMVTRDGLEAARLEAVVGSLYREH